MSKVFVFNHPLINNKLAIIRDEKTGTNLFRQNVNEIASMMVYEATRNLHTAKVDIKTPCGIAQCETLDGEVVIVPILRAGLGMLDGVLRVIPTGRVGYLGLSRDEMTLEPMEYYQKFPKCIVDSNTTVLLVDPMCATGGSVIHACNVLKKNGVKNIIYVGIVGAPEGVKAVQEAHPDVDIYLAALDEKLNEVGYIVPGLGDCGDRLNGTKETL